MMRNERIYNEWLTTTWLKDDADRCIIKLQKIFIKILGIIIFSGWVILHFQSTVYPSLHKNETITKVNAVPQAIIYFPLMKLNYDRKLCMAINSI